MQKYCKEAAKCLLPIGAKILNMTRGEVIRTVNEILPNVKLIRHLHIISFLLISGLLFVCCIENNDQTLT